MLTNKLTKAILKHASDDYPNECCGVISKLNNRKTYIRCENKADKSQCEQEFVISPEEYARIEDEGEVLAIVHSHPDSTTAPSLRDRAVCSAMGIPWVICSWPDGDVRILLPEQMPLLGRPFCHGTDWDCWGQIRDYYDQKLRISLSRYDHDSFWWEEGGDFYTENYEGEGFVKVVDGSLQKHDLIIMKIRSPVANHGAIYVGNGMIQHHLYGKPSRQDVYGGYWTEKTSYVLRHKSLMK